MSSATGSRMTTIATIGVYGFDASTFMQSLKRNSVTMLIDIRQRRGVRGPQYAWANSLRLQAALAEAGVAYVHRRDLAPTTELRQLQYAEDDRRGVGKRSRVELAAAYVEQYEREILAVADIEAVSALLPDEGVAALFCVESDAPACHRSLVARRLADAGQLEISHIGPQ